MDKRWLWGIAAASVLGGCHAEVASEGSIELHSGLSAQESTVIFDDCQEFAGLYAVPYAGAADRVPSQYEVITPDGGTSALVVFRTAQCAGVSVDGGPSIAGIVSQVGVGVVPPLGEGDINNYTVFYGTDHPGLALRLKLAGVAARYVPHLDFDYEPSGGGSGDYVIENPRPRFAHVISGPVSDPPPDDPGIPFVANWWRFGLLGDVVMETTIPALFQGDASSVVVTTDAGTEIAELIGGTIVENPVFAIRGIIPDAVMEVFPVDL